MDAMRSFQLTLLGTEIAFRSAAAPEQVEKARLLVEERYEELRARGGQQNSKDSLLTFLVLGLADDLLQSRGQLTDVQNRIDALLLGIDERV